MKLIEKKCGACDGMEPLISDDQKAQYFNELSDGWDIVEQIKLKKEYRFSNFKAALEFTNKVGQLAEQEGHHPDIYLTWGKVELVIYTHKLKQLTENDFILAAKCDLI